jgi:hypothetical protein
VQAFWDGSMQPTDLFEVTGFISSVWKSRPDLIETAGVRLSSLLPPTSEWPKSFRQICECRFLLEAATHPDVTRDEALSVLQNFVVLEAKIDRNAAQTRVFSVFLWNLYALWICVDRPIASRFRGLQVQKTWDALCDLAKKRADLASIEEVLETQLFVGTLVYLVPELRPILRPVVEKTRWRVSTLELQIIEGERSFPSTFFMLYGMAIASSEQAVFLPHRLVWLLEKAKAETWQCLASRELERWLEIRLKKYLAESADWRDNIGYRRGV